MQKIYLAILLLLPVFCYSQKQGNVWYFEDSCELDFNSGAPVVMPDGNIFSLGAETEGTATISDSLGKLLFYANGRTVWNRFHHVMPNGHGLLGGPSSTQGAFILPFPNNDSLFYLFTTDEFQNNLQNGLRYSVVDMCLDNGLGDILPGKKNILLLDTVAEKMAGTNHANGTDYWLVTHKFYSDAFYSFHISSGGAIDTVISHVGIYEPNVSNVGAAIGQLKISPDGSKLALVFSNTNPCVAELYDFDNTTGIVSNEISLPTDGGEYGVSFSPDNSKLYISTLNSHSLFQYDITSGNPAIIISTKTLIYSNNSLPIPSIQLGPDGKIYVIDNYYLDVINNPNVAGAGCNFVHNAIYLGGHFSGYGITNFIDSYKYHNTVTQCNEVNAVPENNSQNSITLFPNPFSNSTTLQFSTETNYQNTVFKMYDVFGREMKNIKLESSSVEIEKGNLAAGVYFWTVSDAEKILATGKVVVD